MIVGAIVEDIFVGAAVGVSVSVPFPEEIGRELLSPDTGNEELSEDGARVTFIEGSVELLSETLKSPAAATTAFRCKLSKIFILKVPLSSAARREEAAKKKRRTKGCKGFMIGG